LQPIFEDEDENENEDDERGARSWRLRVLAIRLDLGLLLKLGA
jgi:hypothetical protein